MLNKLLELVNYDESRPNKYTIFLGNQIKKAREERELTQAELSELVYVRRATISDIENGKGLVDTSMLALFAHIFGKPLSYFYPNYLYRLITQEDLSPIEYELVIQFKKIESYEHQKLALEIIRTFAKFDPDEIDQELLLKNEAYNEKELEKIRNNPKNYRNSLKHII